MLDLIHYLKELKTAIEQNSDLIYSHAPRHKPGGADALFPADFDISPSADNTYDLGSSSNNWKDIYYEGLINWKKTDRTSMGGIYFPTYLHITHTSYNNLPFIGFNALLTKTSVADSVNEVTPAWAGASDASMGVLTLSSPGRGYLSYYYLQHGTDASTKIFPGDFDLVLKFDGIDWRTVGIIPLSDNTYNLGSSSNRWQTLYLAGQIIGDKIQVKEILVDTTSNRPSAGVQYRLFISTDEQIIYLDDGSSWTPLGAVYK